ncbi:MAG: type ISP restriction/modification enzyme [Planctomycetales bacterium]
MAKRKSRVPSVPPNQHESARILEEYLSALQAIHATGAAVPETSYYPALSNLFNAVGKSLKPKVRCIINLGNQGAGLPDGGLFTGEQFQRLSDGAPKPGQLPSRGAIEAKGTKPEAKAIAASKQVQQYLATYGIVIVTNLREFLIVERGPNGQPAPRESLALADDEQAFWRQAVAHPRATAQEKEGPFVEFIGRACLHAAPLTNPRDVAWFLASYARDALFRVERQKDLPALQAVRAALEDALGMKFTAEKGEHFFRSTLVQTLFYGVFSAWVRWHKDNPGSDARFDWRTAEWSLHVPFIRTLYEEVAKPSRLGPLGLVEVLDWSAAVLNRVDRGEFFARFEDEHAVQYFYEPFLEAYDPELRKELGVWYTPPEIVKYQVARVDRVLRDELDLPDGLADPNVIVLDPCCGTGAYLVEVLHSIAATLRDKGGDALVAADLKEAAMNRVFGFEILPAPFVVSHLQLGSVLRNQGAPLAHHTGERVGVYLTNALTGWAPPTGPKQTVMGWAELQEERDAAEHVKRDKKILVVLGNPPYNAFAGVSPEEEQGLVEPYKKDLNKPTSAGGWGIRKFNLDDLYVRFFRLAERRIAKMSGKGVVSFISNFSYLSDPSFVVMRQRFLTEFDKLWFDCLNGDSRETGKLTPEGQPDPSVFSTEYNRAGIRVGTAICVMVRKDDRKKKPIVRFRDFWGANKRAELLASSRRKSINAAYAISSPLKENRLSLRPENVPEAYTSWPSVVSLCAVEPISGLQEMRKGALMDMLRDDLAARLRSYFDATVNWETLAAEGGGLVVDAARFDARECRAKLLHAESFSADSIRRYSLYPFDNRWCYHSNVRPLWNEPRPDVAAQLWNRPRPKLAAQVRPDNRLFITRPFSERPHEWGVMTTTRELPDYHLLRPNAVAIPVMLRNGKHLSKRQHRTLFDALGDAPVQDVPTANLAKSSRAYLAALGIEHPDADAGTAGMIWMHALAIGYSPAYLTENADGIRRDWPRIPLPAGREALEASAALGERIAALLDTEAEVPGVTTGKLAPIFKTIAQITKVGGGRLDPSGDGLAVTAGWGHAGKAGVTMPGKGRLTSRAYDEDETRALDPDARRLLGETTRDVYLNGIAYWRNIPANVWEYHIGGYQVIKKWLSYRELPLLGRPLKPDEAREVGNTARRIAAIILLQPELDANYQRAKAAAHNWPPGDAGR